jgi:hypothetical protein
VDAAQKRNSLRLLRNVAALAASPLADARLRAAANACFMIAYSHLVDMDAEAAFPPVASIRPNAALNGYDWIAPIMHDAFGNYMLAAQSDVETQTHAGIAAPQPRFNLPDTRAPALTS